MPTYEYKCLDCQHRFDAFQSMTEAPLGECPECKGKLKRLIGTGAGIIFKGSGFYCTDYRSSSYESAAKAEKSATEPAKTPDKAPAKEATAPAKPEKTAASSAA